MVPLQEEASTIRQVAANPGCAAPGDPATALPKDQMMVCNRDRVTNPELPSPQHYGCSMDQDDWLPVMTKLPPAPEAILQLVKCGSINQ